MNRLTQQYDSFTEAEKRVCNYIVKHYNRVVNMSINELADKTFTSKTVVINMSQKLDFKGFTDLRYYIKNYIDNEKVGAGPKPEGENILTLAAMTGNLISEDKIHVVAKLIKKSHTVYIAARGTSKSCAMHLSHLLQTNGIKCMLVDDYNLLSIIARQIDTNETFILMSLSGETQKIIEAAKSVKSRDGRLVSLTSFTHNTLSRLADYNLFAATASTDTVNDDDISRIGFFVIAEILAQHVKSLT